MHGVLEETLIFKTSDFVQFPKSSQYSPFPKKPLVMTTSSLLKKCVDSMDISWKFHDIPATRCQGLIHFSLWNPHFLQQLVVLKEVFLCVGL